MSLYIFKCSASVSNQQKSSASESQSYFSKQLPSSSSLLAAFFSGSLNLWRFSYAKEVTSAIFKGGEARSGCEKSHVGLGDCFLRKQTFLSSSWEMSRPHPSHDGSDLELALGTQPGSTETQPAAEVMKESIWDVIFRSCGNKSSQEDFVACKGAFTNIENSGSLNSCVVTRTVGNICWVLTASGPAYTHDWSFSIGIHSSHL